MIEQEPREPTDLEKEVEKLQHDFQLFQEIIQNFREYLEDRLADVIKEMQNGRE